MYFFLFPFFFLDTGIVSLFKYYWKMRGVMVFNATFNNISSYIVAVSFIGGGYWSAQRKPPNCHKSLTNFIT